MMYRIWFLAVIVLICTMMALACLGLGKEWIVLAGIVALIVLIRWYISVTRPLNAVENGIYLLREQDFSSRLCLTGQRDADNVVKLFNSLMDSMKAERLKLQEQHYLLHKLIEASPTGIALCDFDGHVTMTNKAFNSLVDDRLQKMLDHLHVNTGRVVRDGVNRIMRCSCHLFMDSGFSRRFYLIELMTDEIVKAERDVMGRVVRSIGHEVNNTLSSVITIIDTLTMAHEHQPDVKSTLESCSESCMRLAEFVRRYAEIVKLPPAHLTDVDLEAEIEQMMPFLQTIVGNHAVLQFKAGGRNLKVKADVMLLERVMANVVKNAVESICALKSSGHIVIEVDGSEVRVTDNGSGINNDDAPNLFTPFFSTKNADRGLGLMLVSDILRMHNAGYTLATDPETGLTTFSFHL